eukprot:TRINITY_DN4708_c0_g1_i1.p1 TRINITY_DN4708_c0_g1~~TRINITY_DN4708_c0_g1_i1.p1  ORF type:complete len:558 (+),score=90.18 TRINITY_DN4708_c0_g1_i1:31-1704(+)
MNGTKSGMSLLEEPISNDSVLRLCMKNKNVPLEELEAITMTYTQVVHNPDKSSIRPETQGFNRDASELSIIAPDVAVCAVADGCALRFWSEVAAKVAVHKFVSYIERFFWTADQDITIGRLKEEMVQAILYTNNELLNLVHPLTQQRVGIDDNGGQTTLSGAVVFPFGNSEWGVVAIGMGDSEALIFTGYSDYESPKDGQWIQLVEDAGGHMLPFFNLKKNHIMEPELHVLNRGSTLFLFSDGVRTSYADSIIPKIPPDIYKDMWHSGKYVLQSAHANHSHPDDVTIVGLRAKPLTDGSLEYLTKGYPHRERAIDMTGMFFPSFVENEKYDVTLVHEYVDFEERISKNYRKVAKLNTWLKKKCKKSEKSRPSVDSKRPLLRSATAPESSREAVEIVRNKLQSKDSTVKKSSNDISHSKSTNNSPISIPNASSSSSITTTSPSPSTTSPSKLKNSKKNHSDDQSVTFASKSELNDSVVEKDKLRKRNITMSSIPTNSMHSQSSSRSSSSPSKLSAEVNSITSSPKKEDVSEKDKTRKRNATLSNHSSKRNLGNTSPSI